MAAGASRTRPSTRSGCCTASHNPTLAPNEVPIRLNLPISRLLTAADIVPASSASVRVRVFSGDEPKPGISKAITRQCRHSRSCPGVRRMPPAPWRCTSGVPCPASMYRIRNPSASTKHSRNVAPGAAVFNPSSVCATIGPFLLISRGFAAGPSSRTIRAPASCRRDCRCRGLAARCRPPRRQPPGGSAGAVRRHGRGRRRS